MRVDKRGVVTAIGAALTLTAIMASPVFAETASAATTEENFLNTENWKNLAAANVQSYANIRQGAGTDTEKVGVLLPGHEVEVLSNDGSWSHVQSGDVEGYVRDDLLVFGEEARVHYINVCGETAGYVALTVEQYQELLAQEEARQQEEAQQRAESQQEAVQETMQSAGSGELDLLAAIIQCEAGGESRTGKVAVGAVIMNRVNSGSFPNSISEVVYESGQFSPVTNGALSSVQASGARSDCYEAAQAALAGENPVGSCLYFNSGSGQGTQIGNQHFY
ncbi:MAG: cell wall hydrolase [Lachnospiraceae bacterium]|nr:cell wall hydrolase [Lachnospiraceae bacterium]